MKIQILEITEGRNFEHCYQADCQDCPGSPPVGYGKTKEEAVAALFYQFLFGHTGGPHSHSWLDFIKFGEPIVINGKIWENPVRMTR
jgi:hypothetical protein